MFKANLQLNFASFFYILIFQKIENGLQQVSISNEMPVSDTTETF